jgi:hypothetical protein
MQRTYRKTTCASFVFTRLDGERITQMDPRKEKIAAAQAFLSAVKFHTGYDAIIAGGFVRDLISGLPHRDVDLYLSSGEAQIAAMRLCGEGLDEDAWVLQTSSEYQHQSIEYQDEKQVLPIVAKEHPLLFGDGQPLNLIGIMQSAGKQTGELIVARFNFGICQAWIDKDRIGTTKEFNEDFRGKKITLLRTDWGREASERQYRKLYQKYPWPLHEIPYEDTLTF